MQAIDLNLSTRPFKNDTLVWVGLVVGALVLGLASWWNVTRWSEHRTLLADLRETYKDQIEIYPAALERAFRP